MNKELEALECIVIDLTPEAKKYDAEDIEIVKTALEQKEKLEKIIRILNTKKINLDLLKSTFKFDKVIGYGYYLRFWCMNSLMTFDDSKYISQEEYDLLKEWLG